MTSQLLHFIPQEQTFTWLFLKSLLKIVEACRNVNLSLRVQKNESRTWICSVKGTANKLCARNALLSLGRIGVFCRSR